jgi:hypothetical protein
VKLSGFEVKNEQSYTSAARVCLLEIGWRTVVCFAFWFYVCVFTDLVVYWCMVTYKYSTLSSDYKNYRRRPIGCHFNDVVFCVYDFVIRTMLTLISDTFCYLGGTLLVKPLVEALHYKAEGRRFDSRWFHWNF